MLIKKEYKTLAKAKIFELNDGTFRVSIWGITGYNMLSDIYLSFKDAEKVAYKLG